MCIIIMMYEIQISNGTWKLEKKTRKVVSKNQYETEENLGDCDDW